MPLLIRELTIKVKLGEQDGPPPPATGATEPAADRDNKLVRQAVEEVQRIAAARRER